MSTTETPTRRLDTALAVWVVYRNPADFPGETVARKHLVPGGPTDTVIRGKLENMREALCKQGFFRLDRSPCDDPCIVEVWL